MAAKKKGGGKKRPPATKASPAAKAAKAEARERKGPTQAERLEAARQARKRMRQRNRGMTIGIGVLIVAMIVAFQVNKKRNDDARIAAVTTANCASDTKSDRTSAPPNNHVAPASYEVDPPAGGNHDPAPAPPGVYNETNKPDDAKIVHALEHGYVAIWHRPDMVEADLTELGKLGDKYSRDVLVVPRGSLSASSPVAATVWGRRLICTEVDVKALDAFVRNFRNKGPEKVPH